MVILWLYYGYMLTYDPIPCSYEAPPSETMGDKKHAFGTMEFSYDGHENDWGNLWFDWRNHIDMENHLKAWFLHIYLCFLQGIHICMYIRIYINAHILFIIFTMKMATTPWGRSQRRVQNTADGCKEVMNSVTAEDFSRVWWLISQTYEPSFDAQFFPWFLIYIYI